MDCPDRMYVTYLETKIKLYLFTAFLVIPQIFDRAERDCHRIDLRGDDLRNKLRE
jgi:hypothetical protein